MSELHRVPTPEIATRNFVEEESLFTSALYVMTRHNYQPFPALSPPNRPFSSYLLLIYYTNLFSLLLLSGCHGVGIRRCHRNHTHDLRPSSGILSARAHSPAPARPQADRRLGTNVNRTGCSDRLHLSIIRERHQSHS